MGVVVKEPSFLFCLSVFDSYTSDCSSFVSVFVCVFFAPRPRPILRFLRPLKLGGKRSAIFGDLKVCQFVVVFNQLRSFKVCDFDFCRTDKPVSS